MSDGDDGGDGGVGGGAVDADADALADDGAHAKCSGDGGGYTQGAHELDRMKSRCIRRLATMLAIGVGAKGAKGAKDGGKMRKMRKMQKMQKAS